MKEEVDIDIDALLSMTAPAPQRDLDVAGAIDRQIAREIAKQTHSTTLLLMGRLTGPRCLPERCTSKCSSFKLISMRIVGKGQIAMFSVPQESEMAELFEEIDGRHGLHAIAFDPNGRTKEAYVL
jgi:hypothetical protein